MSRQKKEKGSDRSYGRYDRYDRYDGYSQYGPEDGQDQGYVPYSSDYRQAPDGKRRGKRRTNRLGGLLIILQLIATIAALWSVQRLGFLPLAYVAAGGLIGAAVWFFCLLLQLVRPRGVRIFGKILSLLLIILLGLVTWYCLKTQNVFDQIFGKPADGTTEGPAEQKDIDAATEPFTVYISGNDDYGEITDEPGRSDVNILLTVNPKTRQIVMTSTPRDYYVAITDEHGYTLKTSDGEPAYDKLTHASLAGLYASEAALENLYGPYMDDFHIDYYVKLNFTGFADIVNALGGVTVESDQYFESIDGEHVFYEGPNTLDGYSALLFVRERKYFENGDFERQVHQKAMIRAIMNKVKSPALLLNYTAFMDSIKSCFITDMPQKVIGSLVQLQLEGGDWNLVSNGVVGTPQDAYSYYVQDIVSVIMPDQASVQAAAEKIQQCLDGTIFPEETEETSIPYFDDSGSDSMSQDQVWDDPADPGTDDSAGDGGDGYTDDGYSDDSYSGDMSDDTGPGEGEPDGGYTDDNGDGGDAAQPIDNGDASGGY